MDGKKLKIIPFDGKQENWHMWSRKFKSKLSIQGSRYLLEHRDDDCKEEDWDKDHEEHNSIAYSDILLSMEDEVCFDIVDLSRSKLFPMGCTYTEFKILKEKFESTTQAARCEVKLDLRS